MVIQINFLLASPGGKIAKEFFDSPLGKLLGLLLLIILFPYILRSWYKRKKFEKQIKHKLDALALVNHDYFDQINLKNRMTDIFTRVHKAWSEQDLVDCEQFMTSWYQQNQQTVFLNEWKGKGLMNVCTVQKINSIQPIHIRLTSKENFEGTRVMFAIDANMEDYLIHIDDSSVIEGKKGFKDVETVWTLQLNEGLWKVDNIEQSNMITTYMKMDTGLTDQIIQKIIESRSGIVG